MHWGVSAGEGMEKIRLKSESMKDARLSYDGAMVESATLLIKTFLSKASKLSSYGIVFPPDPLAAR